MFIPPPLDAEASPPAPSWLAQYGPFFRGRRAQMGFRLGATGIIAATFGPVLGWRPVIFWFGAYAILQALELVCFNPRHPWLPEPSRRGAYIGSAFLLVNTLIWGSFSIVQIDLLGAWGFACASTLLSGGIMNAVLTTINCRPAFILSMLPIILYGILSPLETMYLQTIHLPNHPSWFITSSMEMGTLMIVLAAYRLWRETSATKAAEAASTFRDISQRRDNEARLYMMAHRDALTGLANRSVLQSSLAELVRGSAPAALLLIDLDGFKFVNDTFGHIAGDQVLIEVAQRLESCARAGDITMRLGGDEFAVLLPGVGDVEHASEIADRMISNVSLPLKLDGEPINISASIGIVTYPQHGDDPGRLFANADLALYQAKGEGRHRSRHYSPVLREGVKNKFRQDAALLRAVERNEFELFYQPQVRLADGVIIGAEALLRWRHPEQGLLAPAAFLAAIEAGTLAARIGDWVMRTACAQAAAWRQNGLPNFRVAVNLFGAQFRSGSLVEKTKEACARVNLPPDGLDLEITENIILRHEDDMVVPLTQLRALGVGIAFDDYGTGYASLSLLKRYPLSGLKIDKGFTQAICEKPSDAAIVRAIISLGEAFDLKVIAEGVETEAQALMLARGGCREAQGYYFGRPVTAADFTQQYVTCPADRHKKPHPVQ